MRCPKCHYVSFDGQSRCRNCGYDFSLAQPAPDPELPTRTETAATPLADLSLKADAPGRASDEPTLVDRLMPPQPVAPAGAAAGPGGNARAGAARAPQRAPDTDPMDLPLFNPGPSAEPKTEPMRVPPAASRAPADDRPLASSATSQRTPADDRPLVSGATPPRPPLAVRRPTGEGPRARPRVTPQATPPRIEEPRLDLGLDAAAEPDLDDLEIATGPQQPRDIAASIAASRAAASRAMPSREASAHATAAAHAAAGAAATDDPADDPAIESDLAPIGTRIAAGLIDLAFILAVDAVVLHFTLRITGLPLNEWRRLPVAPLIVFLFLLHGGYLTMFTAASGQTMGKMLLNLRVVASRGGPVPFGSAALRAVVWLLTILPAGVGFLPAILTADRRALHDRFADTKVITVSD
jgi:uncharacterized RDD family membrane protein YckC